MTISYKKKILEEDNIEHIGRYHVQKSLGNSRHVYEAYDERLERLIVLKVLSEKNAANFLQREAQAIARLKHHNIVKIFDFGNDGKHFFITMEYLSQNTLQNHPENTSSNYTWIAETIKQISDGIHHAHQQGIIHRNLKPTNVLFQEDLPKITDFGLVKFIDTATNINIIKGALPYMAPEQILDNVSIDQKTDIYSIGILLYELLTGKNPFENITLTNASDVLKQPIKPPRKINPNIPKELEKICLKCLEKRKKNRYRNAKLISKELQEFLEKKRLFFNTILLLLIFVLLIFSGILFVSNKNLQNKIKSSQIQKEQINKKLNTKNLLNIYMEPFCPIFQKYNWQILDAMPSIKNRTNSYECQFWGKRLFNYSLEFTNIKKRDHLLEKAIENFLLAIKLNKKNQHVYFFCYLAYLMHSTQNEKKYKYLNALKKFPNELGYYAQALEIVDKNQKPKKKDIPQLENALRLINKAITINYRFGFLYNLKGKIFELLQREGKLKCYNEGLQVATLNPFLVYYRCLFYYKKNNFKMAFLDINNAIKAKVTTEKIWFVQSKIFEKLHKYKEALESVNISIKINHFTEYTYIHRLGIYEKIGMYNKALKDTNTLIKINPKNANFYAIRAKIYTKLKKPFEALKNYKKSYLLDNTKNKVLLKMAQIYNQIGDSNQATKMWTLYSKSKK